MRWISSLVILSLLCLIQLSIAAVPELISYQGFLTDAVGDPVADGQHIVTFTIYDAASGGNSKWSEDVKITTVDGLFNVLLGSDTPIPDSVFNTDIRYFGVQLESDPEMTPRTRLVTVPYSYHSVYSDTAEYALAGAGGSVWTQTGNVIHLIDPDDTVGVGTSTPTTKLDVKGNARIEGKLSVGPGTNNSGTNAFAAGSNNSASGEFSVVSGGNNNVASDSACVSGGVSNLATGDISVVAGGWNNVASFRMATVGGGSGNTASHLAATIAGGFNNTASDNSTTVAGGNSNEASAAMASIGGGFVNAATGLYSTVGGGFKDTADGEGATVSGGINNHALGDFNNIGGGKNNYTIGIASTVSGGEADTASGYYSTVAGGQTNTASGTYSTVSGGSENVADFFSTVSGGNQNSASWEYSTVGGGLNNTAIGSFNTIAGGRDNIANNIFSSVLGGKTNTASGIYSTVIGGVNNTASSSYATVAGGRDNVADGDFSFAAGRHAKANHNGTFVWADQTNSDFASAVVNQFRVRASGGTQIFSNAALTTGVSLAAGGGAWAAVSDSTVKDNIRPVDGEEILDKLSQLDITRWNYETQDESIEHIGPMAQDFYRLFGVGDNNTTISTIDPDGIALAAIKALIEKNQILEASNKELNNRMKKLEKIVEELNNQ